MIKLVDSIEAINRVLGKGAAWCALAMMLFQIASVLFRYVFSFGLITFQEAVIYCHAILFLLGAAYVLQLNQHVRVDILYNAMPARMRKAIDLIGLLFFVLPVACVIGWIGFPYMMRAWATLEGSRQAGGIPAIYLLKTTIVVFATSLAFQALATAARIVFGLPNPHWQAPDENSDRPGEHPASPGQRG